MRGACEILGLDPLYVANEGKLLAIVAPRGGRRGARRAARAPARREGGGRSATVVAEGPGRVTLKSRIGGVRVVDLLTGEQLPRIC